MTVGAPPKKIGLRTIGLISAIAVIAKAAKHRSRPRLIAISAVILLVATVLAYLLRPALPPPRITGYTQITNDGQQKSFNGQVTAMMLTDGPRLYLQENVGGHFVVAQVSASGGETVVMPIPFPNVALDNISADKSELIVGSFTGAEENQPLWAVPVLGGSPRRFGDEPGADGVKMPNGDLLIAHDNELTAVGSNGEHRKFATLPKSSTVYWLRWSPDGHALHFTTNDSVGFSQWETAPDGGNLHRLFSSFNPGNGSAHGSWTHDGNYFLFSALQNGRWDVWAVRDRPDQLHKVSYEPVQLTSGPLSFEAVEPSTDGKKVFVAGIQPRAELVRYDSKSGQFLPYLEGISAKELAFSRDGHWISYVSFPEGNLWRCRSDGSNKVQLTSAPLFVDRSAFSADGSQIAFAALQPGKGERLYLVSATGGIPRELPVGQMDIHAVNWAPGGDSIIFEDADTPDNSFIRSVDLKSMKVFTLPNSQARLNPHLSPDGRYLVANTVDAQKLLLFDFTRQKWSELASASVGYKQWSSDSKYVYFDTGYSTESAIYRVRVSDRKLERVASFKGLRRVVAPFVAWSGLTPDGSPLLMRDIGTQEVYALNFEAP